MTPSDAPGTPRLTVSDVRHHAEEVRNLALDKVRALAAEESTKAAVVGVVVVIGLMSAAYYFGSRAARRRP